MPQNLHYESDRGDSDQAADRRTMAFCPAYNKQKPTPPCPDGDFQCRQEKAIARCAEQIQWYEREKCKKRILYWIFQNAVIVLSALTPLLILWGNAPDDGSRQWLGVGPPSALAQAIPPALAAMLASIISSYQWREQWTRFGFTAEMLKSERAKFETRTTADYRGNQDAALDTFVARIETLISAEVGDWRTLFQSAKFEPSSGKDDIKDPSRRSS
jgi:hypothetical protein